MVKKARWFVPNSSRRLTGLMRKLTLEGWMLAGWLLLNVRSWPLAGSIDRILGNRPDASAALTMCGSSELTSNAGGIATKRGPRRE